MRNDQSGIKHFLSHVTKRVVNDFLFPQLFFDECMNIGNKELKPKNTAWFSKSGILYSVIQHIQVQ